MEILHTFSMTRHQIEKKNWKNTLAQYPKEFINEVLSDLVQLLWGNGFRQTDGQKDGWLDGRTDKAAPMCSPFGEHNEIMD